jgi:hypothetical protein
MIFPNLLFITVLIPERMRPRARLRHILCDNNKMELKNGLQGLDTIHVTQDRDKRWAVVKMVMNFRVP